MARAKVVVDDLRGASMTITVRVGRGLRVRLAVAKGLIWLAGWVLRCRLTVQREG